MENAVILSQKEYNTLQALLNNKDERIEKLRELINTNEKYIIIESINNFTHNIFKNNFKLDYPKTSTPKEFRKDIKKYIEELKILNEVCQNKNNKKWYKIWK